MIQVSQHIDVEGEICDLEPLRLATHVDLEWHVLVPAEHQAPLFWARVHTRFVDPDDRMMRLDSGNGFRDEKLVTGGNHRDPDPNFLREQSRPGAAGIDNHGGPNVTAGR